MSTPSDPTDPPQSPPAPISADGEPSTEQIPQRGQYPDPLTKELPTVTPGASGATGSTPGASGATGSTPASATEQAPLPPVSTTLEYPEGFGDLEPPPPPPPPPASGPDGTEPPPSKGGITRFLRDPLSITLVVVIVAALSLAGLVGIELWARNKAADVVARAAACVVEDSATATFGGATPFLWQHFNREYTNISITTAGNRIRDLEGLKADIRIDDVHITNEANTKGTLGSMQVTVTWSADGIKKTVQQRGPEIANKLQAQFSSLIPGQLLVLAQPLIASAAETLVTDVTTNPSSDSIELSGAVGSLSVSPSLKNGRISLTATGASFKIPILGEQPLPTEAFQPLVEQFTGQLEDDLPLGLQPVSLDVTDTGVVAVLSTTNATIPRNQSGCFNEI